MKSSRGKKNEQADSTEIFHQSHYNAQNSDKYLR
jgi:hypothetical protein